MGASLNNKPHILFVCGRNQWRSPTAARVYANDQRIEVRSAGVSGKSQRQVSAADVAWAELILVMEPKYAARLRDMFPDIDLPAMESLDIPDDYAFMDLELVDLIRAGTEFHLEQHCGIAQAPDDSR
jgi:predicted protein tyrosine phosphatase